jgi:uncharacterized membrane protein YjgN (DUF898 family)
MLRLQELQLEWVLANLKQPGGGKDYRVSIDNSVSSAMSRPVHAAASTETVDGWQLRFTGQGGEYFKIWIVNLALTIVTLGIYSAWAKVRRLRYFYANTTLAGSSFDFHGSPMAILKGRLVALVVLGAYSFAPRISLVLYAAVAVVIMLGFPWLYWRSLRFRLGNTSYRGARFGFLGKLSGAYAAVLPPALLFLGINVVLALSSRGLGGNDPRSNGILVLKVLALYGIAILVFPYYYHRVRAYQHGNAAFGASQFRYRGRAGQFYMLAGKIVLMSIGLIVMIAIIGAFAGMIVGAVTLSGGKGGGMWMAYLFGLLGYAGFFAVYPFAVSRTQNIVWPNTQISDARFLSKLSFHKTLGVELVNILATIFTIGLFRPFAAIRSARIRIEALTFDGDPGEFEAAAYATGGATGAELGEMIGFDIAL